MITVLIDHSVSGVSSDGSPPSLLMLPVGARTLLQHLACCLGHLRDGDLLVMPDFPYDRSYEKHIGTSGVPGVRVLNPSALIDILKSGGPAEDLLVIDPIQWPIHPVDVHAILSSHSGYAGFTHAVAVGTDPESIRECVEFDRQGRVQCVRRHFQRTNWPQVASTTNFLSIGPARAVGNACFRCLSELRTALSAQGVLNYDMPIPLDAVSLIQPAGMLSLNEQILARLFAGEESPPDGFIRDGEMLIGPDARVHSSARLIGHVVVHPGAVIEKEATILGPTVVGAMARIGRGATIAQSIIAADTVVASGATVRHSLAWGQCSKPSVHFSINSYSETSDFNVLGEVISGSATPHVSKVHRIRLRIEEAAKRIGDVILSLIVLVILAPFMLIVAIVIKLESPGPVLFKHRREQKEGKEFSCFKFRTMRNNAHHEQRGLYKNSILDGPQFKLADDPRITKVGHILRRYNIDELPQLLNVILGQMSLVGPRPSPFRENQLCLTWRRARLSVRPGITGLWQICRSQRAASDFEQWIFYDVLYVRSMSFWLDFKILLATALTGGGMRRVPLSYIVPKHKKVIPPVPYTQP